MAGLLRPSSAHRFTGARRRASPAPDLREFHPPRALTLALALLNTASAAPAATYHLNADGTGDFATIVAAIAAASPGDSILLAAGLYLGAGNTQLDYGGKDIVIAGAGSEATILDCEDSGQPAVLFESGETRAAVLRDMTLRNNRGEHEPTGVAITGASPTLANLHLEDFDGIWNDYWPNYFQGPALHSEGASPRIEDVEVRDCTHASGVYLSGGSPELERVLIEDCTANYASAGGLRLIACAALLREVTIRDCSVYGGIGGGALCFGEPSPVFEDCRFEGNWQHFEGPAAWPNAGGGGLACIEASPVLRRCTFVGNDARDSGGGLACADGAEPLLEDVLFADNGAASGGSAVFVSESSPALRGVTITSSRVHWFFGHEVGVPSSTYCMYSALVMERVIIANNAVGTGLYVETGNEPVLSCSDFFANPGGNYGGTLADQTGLNGNISADPLFCDAPGGEYTLDALSPCLPANNECGLQMGAYGWGCGVTAAEETTPTAFAFAPPQPNPFNPKTTLRFALPSGVYFARFAAGGFTAEQKLVLLR